MLQERLAYKTPKALKLIFCVIKSVPYFYIQMKVMIASRRKYECIHEEGIFLPRLNRFIDLN